MHDFCCTYAIIRRLIKFINRVHKMNLHKSVYVKSFVMEVGMFLESMYEDLFLPFELKGKFHAKNRFVLSPMVTNSSTQEGYVTEDDLLYARRRADSAALQITGAAYVDVHGQLFEYGFSIVDDSCIEGLSQLAQEMKRCGNAAILQLTHAGRFASHALKRDGYVYGPSPMRLNAPFPHEVKELSIEEIEEIVSSYANATRRAIRAGFDGVEISAAQRLLMQTFFSKFSNERKDRYGCQSFSSRVQFSVEVFQAVRRVIEEEASEQFILGFRATAEETRGHHIGYSIEEFMEWVELLHKRVSIDYLALASWGRDIYLNEVRSAGSHYGKLVTQVIWERFGGRIPIITSGGINSADKAIEALKYADFVGLSTPFITDPEFAYKIQTGQPSLIQLRITPEQLSSLAIPKASFKDIVPLMDYGESLPKDTRLLFTELERNYEDKL